METEKRQIIVYVDQSKFRTFFPKSTLNLKNDNEIVVYFGHELRIFKNNNPLLNEQLKSAILILRPDTNNLEYTPDKSFKILFHTQTSEYKKINHLEELKENKRCEGFIENQEEKGSIYEDIADLILRKDGHRSFEEIYSNIPNVKLEASLEFLHQCFGEGVINISILTNIGKFTEAELNELINKKDSIYSLLNELKNNSGEDFFRTLTNVRDALFYLSGSKF
jgi:hypothetical protein